MNTYKIIVVMMVGLVCTIILTISFVTNIRTKACERAAKGLESSSYEYHYGAGCYVEVDGHLVPLDNVKINAEKT